MKDDSKNKILIFGTVDAMNKSVAKLLVDIAKRSIAELGRFVLCLSGGNTPKSLYTLLSQSPNNEETFWKDTFVFWGDERCVPYNDDSNNAHMATMTLLNKVDIPQSNIFPVPVNLSPAEAANSYEKIIRDFFGNEIPRFDLVLLGLGDNGHTASIFPDTEVVGEQVRLVKEVFVEEQNMYRITMTAPLINRAHNIAFLVTGTEKANILKTVLTSPYHPDKYPAQLIKPNNGELYWFADDKAASYLINEKTKNQ